MNFPTDGMIEDTRWELIARQYLPGSDHPDINELGIAFIEYLTNNGVSVYHPSVSHRFQFFCKHLALS